MTTLSVCICTYKRPDFLDRVLNSVVPQMGDGREIVVVNDGSHNDAYEVVRQKFGDGIRYHICPQNGGIAKARNVAASLATGEYVVYLDDDCVAPADWLDWLDARLSAYPEIDIVAGNTTPLTPEGGSTFRSRWQGHFGFVPRVFAADGFVVFPTANAAIRRSLIDRLGGFGFPGPFFSAAEDTEFGARAQMSGASVKVDWNWTVEHETGEGLRALVRRYRRYGFANGALSWLTSSPLGNVYIAHLKRPFYWQFRYYLRTVLAKSKSYPGPWYERAISSLFALYLNMNYEHSAYLGRKQGRRLLSTPGSRLN